MTFDLCKGYQTMHFWKALITYYHHAKFQNSEINSLYEKFNIKVLDLHADADADNDDRHIPMQYISTQTHLASQFHQKPQKQTNKMLTGRHIVLNENTRIITSLNKKAGWLNEKLAMNYGPS